MSLTPEETSRYSRQLLGQGFSREKQAALKESTVLVAGVGGLGGTAALYLAAAGVGTLIIVHAGDLELPDMNRQVLMDSRSIGKERVLVARKRLLEINPHIEVVSVSDWINENNVEGLVAQADIVVDCRHNFKERSLLNKVCVTRNKIMIEGAMDDMFGYITTIAPDKTPCLSCLFAEFPDWDYLGFAVIGVTPGILGNLMALEAVKVITRIGQPLYSELLTFDGQNMEFNKFNIKKDPACSVCGESI